MLLKHIHKHILEYSFLLHINCFPESVISAAMSTDLVSPNSSSNPQNGWGFQEVMCICSVVHHTVQVLRLRRRHHPAYEPALHLGAGPIAVALWGFLTYHLHTHLLRCWIV